MDCRTHILRQPGCGEGQGLGLDGLGLRVCSWSVGKRANTKKINVWQGMQALYVFSFLFRLGGCDGLVAGAFI